MPRTEPKIVANATASRRKITAKKLMNRFIKSASSHEPHSAKACLKRSNQMGVTGPQRGLQKTQWNSVMTSELERKSTDQGDVIRSSEQAVLQGKKPAPGYRVELWVHRQNPQDCRLQAPHQRCTDCAFALADNQSGRRSAFLAGTVKRNTPLRLRLRMARRMALHGCVKCPSRARCKRSAMHLCHLPCVREKWTLLRRSRHLRGARITLHHLHHAVMLPISLAARSQAVLRTVTSGE
jgi:hypothetical protein